MDIIRLNWFHRMFYCSILVSQLSDHICKKEMNTDDFAEHAINMHEDEVLDLLSDDDIIEGLSDRIG